MLAMRFLTRCYHFEAGIFSRTFFKRECLLMFICLPNGNDLETRSLVFLLFIVGKCASIIYGTVDASDVFWVVGSTPKAGGLNASRNSNTEHPLPERPFNR